MRRDGSRRISPSCRSFCGRRSVADPGGEKFVNNLARPGGDMTGVGTLPVDVSGKCLALLKEAVPRLTQVSLLANPTYASIRRYIEEYRAAADSLGLTVREVQASKPDDLQAAIAAITEDGLVVVPDNLQKEKPDLLDFRGVGSKWQIVHGWLRHGGRL